MATITGIDTGNRDIINKLAHCTYSQFKEALENKHQYEDSGFWSMESQYKQIKYFCKDLIKNNYKLNVNYERTNGETEGRHFSNHKTITLQGINKYIRGCICDGFYRDYDMVNAHPTILKYICKLENIETRYLDNYILDRDNKLNNLKDFIREEAKLIYIKSLNSKNNIEEFDKKNIKDEFFINFDKEIKQIQTQLVKAHPELRKKAIKKGKSHNVEGTVTNYLMCKYEDIILNEVCQTLKCGKIYSFDGFQEFETHELVGEKMIKALDNLTYDKYGIKWSEKEHDLSIYNKIMSWDISNVVISHIADDSDEMSKYLLNGILKNKIVKSGSILFYNQNNKWTFENFKSLEVIKSDLRKFINDNDLYVFKNNKNVPVKSILSVKNELVTNIIDNAPNDSDFNKKLYESTLGKICFKNGYYDFDTHTFETNYTKIQTPTIINYDLHFESNQDIRKDIYNKVLFPIFSIKDLDNEQDKARFELMRHYLKCVARAMAGRVEDKRWFLMEGLRNSGKGVLTDLLKNCFQSYIKTTNSNNLIAKKSTGDSAKELSWILDYEFCRLAVTQEISVINDETKLDGNMIKKFVSGGDYMEARKNFKDEKEFRIQSSLMICCNDLPNINNTDCMENCLNFQMKSKFIDSSEKEELSNYYYFKKDNTVKTEFIKFQAVINEFVLMLIDYYKMTDTFYPENIKIDEQDDETDDMGQLFEAFEITSNLEDVLSNNDIKNHLQKIKSPFKLHKASKLLIGKGALKYRNATTRGLQKIKLKFNN